MQTEQEKNLEVAKRLRLFDDDFLRLYFNDNPSGVEYILNVLLQRNDLKVVSSDTQCEYRSLSERSISLDIYAKDSSGKVYNVEVQRANSGASAKRARYHSSMLDTKLLKKNEPFKNLTETYVIMLTENDVMDCGLPLYHYDRVCEETKEYLNDEAHIIYVNGEYQDKDTQIGRLMHDFKCVKADDMYSKELSERFRYFKETEGGKSEMCKLVEDRAKEYAQEAMMEKDIKNIKRLLKLGSLSHQDIATSLDVSLDLVEKVANGNVA